MKLISGIYKITNIKNNKIYIGISRNINKRWKKHISDLNGKRHINKHLQASWNKYGQEAFIFEIIEECDDINLLKEKEMELIKKFKSSDSKFGYNKTIGGDGVKDDTGEIRKKISLAETLYPVIQCDLAGNYIAEYQNCAQAAKSVNGSTENIRLCCKHSYGRKTSKGFIWMFKDEYLKNGCDIERYKPILPSETGCKPVLQYTLDGFLINKYKSAREAEKETGIGYKLISRVCRGERTHTYGYVFKFADIGDIYG